MGRQTVVTIKPTKQANGIYNSEGNLDWGGTIATFFPCLDDDKIEQESEGLRFESMLRALAQGVGAVAIVLPDSAIRHTLSRKPKHADKTEEELRQVGLKVGDGWLARNEPKIREILGSKLKGLWRWRDFLETDPISGISMLKLELPEFFNEAEKSAFFVKKRAELERLLNPKTRAAALTAGCSIPGISSEHLAPYLEQLEFSTGASFRSVRASRNDKFDPNSPLAQIIRRHNHEEAMQFLLWAEVLRPYRTECPDGSIIPYAYPLTKAMSYLTDKVIQPREQEYGYENVLMKVNLTYNTRTLSDKKRKVVEQSFPGKGMSIVGIRGDVLSQRSGNLYRTAPPSSQSLPALQRECSSQQQLSPGSVNALSEALSEPSSEEEFSYGNSGNNSPVISRQRTTPPMPSSLERPPPVDTLTVAKDMVRNGVDLTLQSNSPEKGQEFLRWLLSETALRLDQLQKLPAPSSCEGPTSTPTILQK